MAKGLALCLAVAAASVVVVMAVEEVRMKSEAVVGLAAAAAATPEKCCVTTEGKGQHISTNITVLNTFNSDAVTVLATQIDIDRGLQVMLNYTLGSSKPVAKSLIDYNKKVLYMLSVDHPDSYCGKVPFNLPTFRCIPEDAEYLGSSFFGPLVVKLPYDTWRFKPKPSPGDKSGIPLMKVVYTLAVSREGCVPLVQGAHYPDGFIADQVMLFSDFQNKLTDPSAFNLPDICFQ